MLIVRYAASGASISAAPSIRCAHSTQAPASPPAAPIALIGSSMTRLPLPMQRACASTLKSNSVPTPAPGTTPPAYDPMHAAPPHVFAIGHGLPRPATAAIPLRFHHRPPLLLCLGRYASTTQLLSCLYADFRRIQEFVV